MLLKHTKIDEHNNKATPKQHVIIIPYNFGIPVSDVGCGVFVTSDKTKYINAKIIFNNFT